MTDPAGHGERAVAAPAAPLAPGPAKVEGNDWKSLDTTPLEGFKPRLSATVVVPYYQAPDELALTLAGLERQSYPRDLFEVIVVDDGSDPPLEMSEPSPLDVRVIHQPDLGFGLARARNNGARAAQGDIVVFLDCDMIPASEWLAAHARWHHAASDAMSIGFRRHLDVTGVSADDVRNCGTLDEMFADRPFQRPEWIESHMARTAELTSEDDDLFRVASGGNLGMSRHFYWEVGGNDESFTQWGAEDVEFGYRAFTLGALLVPERRALCWHQGEGATPSPAEARSLEQQRAKLSQLIAHHGFRRATPGRSFTVPQYVVSVATDGTGINALLDTVEGLLEGDVHDLVVWIEQRQPAGEEEVHEAETVRRLLGGDPRVRFGPRGGAPSGFAASQFHIFVQAGTPVATDLVSGLRKQLGSAECAATSPRDGSVVVLVRARRLHRELRRGLDGESITAATLVPRLLRHQAASIPTGEQSLPDDVQAASGVPFAPDGASTNPADAPQEVSESDEPDPSRRRHPRDTKSRPATTPAVAQESARGANEGRLPRLRKLGGIAAHTATEARSVRNPGDAARLARTVGAWIIRAAGWRLRWIAFRLRRV
ncbi:MAG: glycosyltransferase, partial [Acidimicrobiia bacterium]|nr:glycosyltransferase [Acidimicrobiia bacterium]